MDKHWKESIAAAIGDFALYPSALGKSHTACKM